MDIYAEITNRMIAEMEQGIIPWRKPWMAAGAAISHTTGKPYSLLNQMLLGRAGEWLTFKQCHDEGGYVRKGEKARFVVFWTWLDKEDEETGEVKQIPFLKYYNVFHISQCEGIAAKHMQQNPNPASADETAENKAVAVTGTIRFIDKLDFTVPANATEMEYDELTMSFAFTLMALMFSNPAIAGVMG